MCTKPALSVPIDTFNFVVPLGGIVRELGWRVNKATLEVVADLTLFSLIFRVIL